MIIEALHGKLKLVPAINKQELLFYIIQNFPNSLIKINTIANAHYCGTAVNIGNTKDDGYMLIVQLTNDRGDVNGNILQIAVNKIESIELLDTKNSLAILSLGKTLSNNTYEASGKLEVLRIFEKFETEILASCSVNVGTPQMVLPSNEFALGRILKLTPLVQNTIINLLKAHDACESWRKNYTAIFFEEHETLEVKGINGAITILFPFSVIDAPEIDSNQLTTMLMAVL